MSVEPDRTTPPDTVEPDRTTPPDTNDPPALAKSSANVVSRRQGIRKYHCRCTRVWASSPHESSPPRHPVCRDPRSVAGAKQPVKLRVLAQLANPGDQTADGSMPWPDDRKVVELGVVTLTTIAPNNAALQRSLTFNPVFLCDGIQLSDDPLPTLRSAVYALSILHRRP
jgi:hypothetical protein